MTRTEELALRMTREVKDRLDAGQSAGQIIQALGGPNPTPNLLTYLETTIATLKKAANEIRPQDGPPRPTIH